MTLPFDLSFRKILIGIGLVILAIGLGFGIYLTFFATAPSEPVTSVPEKTGTGLTTGGLPLSGIAEQKPGEETVTEGTGATTGLPQSQTVLSSSLTITPAQNTTLSSDGNAMQYYDSISGLFYKVDTNGSLTPLSSKTFYQVQNATWSNDKNKAVLEYPDGSNIIYDFATDSQTTLPKHWEDFEFAPNNNKIIAKSIGTDPSSRWLVVSDTNGANAEAIYALGENADKVQIAWSPNDQVVGFSATGDATTEFGTQEIYLLGKNKENLKSLKVPGFDFSAKWADEGDRVFYSVTSPNDGYKPTLWAVDASGENIGANAVKIGLNTWIDKCAVISGYRAYCAVPKSLDDGAGFDRRLGATSDDVFYLVDFRTGNKTFIAEPDTDYSVNQISVDANENYIYFTDTVTGALHKIEI